MWSCTKVKAGKERMQVFFVHKQVLTKPVSTRLMSWISQICRASDLIIQACSNLSESTILRDCVIRYGGQDITDTLMRMTQDIQKPSAPQSLQRLLFRNNKLGAHQGKQYSFHLDWDKLTLACLSCFICAAESSEEVGQADSVGPGLSSWLGDCPWWSAMWQNLHQWPQWWNQDRRLGPGHTARTPLCPR